MDDHFFIVFSLISCSSARGLAGRATAQKDRRSSINIIYYRHLLEFYTIYTLKTDII